MCITCKQKCDRNVCELWFRECALFRFQSWNNEFSIQVAYRTQIRYKNAIKCTESARNALLHAWREVIMFILVLYELFVWRDRPGEVVFWNCCWWLTFCFSFRFTFHLTLKMTTSEVVETSVTNNSLSKDYLHPDNHGKQITDTPGFKPFTTLWVDSVSSNRFQSWND